MQTNRVIMEVSIGDQHIDLTDPSQKVVFNMVFLDTGEIRQKIRNWEWLAKRVFQYEMKTWTKQRIGGEKLLFERTKL